MAKRYYKVAEHQFSVDADEDMFSLMQNYEPFIVNGADDACDADAVFSLSIVQGAYVEYVEEMRQSEEGQDIICGHTAENLPTFEFVLRGVSTGMLVCSKDYKSAKLYLPEEKSKTNKFSIDNALMVLYALATANLGTALFHAAVVTYQNRGYLFLGKSGTGKSTHARLWLRHIAGTELLNDDNPVVRFFEDGLCAKVYGSPWSGKTPCYKNMDAPLGGFVLLEQAPHNKIERLRGVSAYAALLPSISGKRWDRAIADGLHRIENSLASHVPVWHLECLPDEAAAKLCCETIA
ncbi:hypothetical protein [Fibrobacter sp. UWB12]|uniref:hypothetical protein n=1 Tax=Fibrobacter sp. UWB12 TaxID=1896203 RepID=UPI00091AF477|nr:hypothetical protein [Fibrobacter sp. UWB12]SHK78181.1 hypothetical protein SAMN05720759_106192 [Fibrobacter sp. UWB12]